MRDDVTPLGALQQRSISQIHDQLNLELKPSAANMLDQPGRH